MSSCCIVYTHACTCIHNLCSIPVLFLFVAGSSAYILCLAIDVSTYIQISSIATARPWVSYMFGFGCGIRWKC